MGYTNSFSPGNLTEDILIIKINASGNVLWSKLYGGTDGHKYVNGVLDKIAAQARPDEFKR